MSTAQQAPASTSAVERRFYPRIAPRTPIYVAFENGNQALLLNVSENGLLMSIPAVLPRNFVARAFVALNGLPAPVRVSVRVIWVSEGRKQTGIQLLDLSDDDREQIRKWGAQESAPEVQTQPSRARVAAPPSTTSSETANAKPPLVAPPFNRPRNLAPPPHRVVVRTRSTSATAGVVMWGVLVALVCFVAVFFLKHGALGSFFPRSTENLNPSIAAPSQESQDNPQSPDASEPGASGNPASLAASSDAPGSESAPPRDTLLRHSAQTRDEANGLDTAGDNGGPQVSALIIQPIPRDASPVNSIPSAAPSSENNLPADISRPVQAPESRNDASLNRTIPADDASKTSSSTPSSSTPRDVTPETLPAVPNPPAAKQALPNPVRPNEVFPSASTMLSLSPIVASTRSASSPRSDSSVIQMDSAGRQVMEIRPSSRYHSSFFNLPGERVLESPTMTIHIQRSVHMPAARAWWPFNRNKKVIVGELVSRVDPQGVPAQTGPSGSVRVNVTVAEDGHVENVRPINGPANLVPSVVRAVHEWRYAPTLLDAKPVETECYVVVQFHTAPSRAARP